MRNQLKKMKKLLGVMMVAIMTIALTCGCSTGGKGEEVTITFMNGESVLGSVTAKSGEKVTDFEKYETQDGYEFDGWFETPTLLESSKKDLSKDTFDKDTTLYGSFKSTNVTEDTRVWTVCGTGKGAALALSNWDNNCSDDAVSFKATGKQTNEFALTLDMYSGDQFQVIHDNNWDDQRGYGCFKDLDPACFENGGGLSGSDAKSNINVIQDGNYTITLVTDPDNSAQDVFTIVRNGDPAGAAVEVDKKEYEVSETTQVVVKGSWVSDWSENKDLTREADTDTFKITLDLDAGIEVYFMIWDNGEDTGLGLNYENVTEDSKALLEEGYNIKVKDAGSYTFTVDAKAMTVAVTK